MLPPFSMISTWRPASYAAAWRMKRIEFRFLISQRVPRLAAGTPHRDVDVGAQRPLLHVAVAGPQIAQDRAQLRHEGSRLLGRAHVGLGDDLHQRDPGAVQIDPGLARVAVVQALPGVLLEMEAEDADGPPRAVLQRHLDRAAADDGLAVLRDLIALRQVGVEVVLRSNTETRLISASRPSPVRTACSTQYSLMTGSIPGIAASTSETCALGSPPNAVDAPENSLDSETTWAWTSSPITVSQAPLRPSIKVTVRPRERERRSAG